MSTLAHFSPLLVASYYLLHEAYSQCSWTIQHEGQPISLDLHCLSSMTFDAKDSATPTPHDYFWTVCRNGETCHDEEIMVKETGEQDCFNLGVWEASVEPLYRDAAGGTWTFEYFGASDCGDPKRTWAPTFECSPGTIYSLSEVEEFPNPGSCFYKILIKTQYACINNTYSCSNCVWNIGDSLLNLTKFENETLVASDSKNSSLFVAFSPCANLMTCNNQKVSSERVDIIDNECVDYLSIWENDGSIQPQYDSALKTWRFVYGNGQKCGDLARIFEVYWHCDYQTKNTPKIVSAQEVDICTYTMHINSSYACT